MNRSLAVVALLGVALAGCSSPSSSTPSTNTPSTNTVTTSTPSATSRPTPSGTGSPLDSGLGQLPSYLPTPSNGGLATGTVQNPALSYPGSPVLVSDGGREVRVMVEGPASPADTPVGAERLECTFTVTLGQASASFPLAAAHFDVLDHVGTVHPVAVVGAGLPGSVEPGQSVTVRVQAVLPSGEGLLRFHPGGGAAAAGWDYVAETD